MKELIKKLESISLFLSAHPDNEPGSEMADRLDNLMEVINSLKNEQLTTTDRKIVFTGFKDVEKNDIYFEDLVSLISPSGYESDEILMVKENFELWSSESGKIMDMHDLHQKGYEFKLWKP